ncbi:AlbA family DNA-binding domain-containing protein [Bacillus subtilis]|uniref:AlbA family DNA-binding domain-containing protein n=2 Tax=Bacillus subtilis TaxID=1423 RepID=UPI000FFE2DC2|nr:ATP-binding protein [Bacillus subtilis]MEC1316013.1 ATP-binding protein [Bacillus subtilis]MED4876132.1 ATP-binding protein [Bacillus subtilis]NCT24033.1 ATP-binding protein [Bacillus subtilis subsp. subtilis]QAT57987.1 ATP-binding protein [Bacillus subtilis]QHM05578.1 hypothetical protein C7M27_01515 [Bacillus subtilis]
MMEKLENKINRLLSLGYEGEYWDFKEKWHTDNGKLVHDILCFANTVHDKDCFIIVGVSDSGELKGLDEHERKQQANIIDMLRNLNFSGDRPNVFLRSLKLRGKTIDVLIIPNSIKVPYFLKKDYKKVKSGFIYTRTGDSNTPIDQNSTISVIEALWRKRFGLNKTGLERFNQLLKDKLSWEYNDYGYYYAYSPEYELRYKYTDSPRETITEFYSYAVYNEHTTTQQAELIVNGTVLKEIQLVTLDGGKYMTPSPEWEYIKFGFDDIYDFKYFIIGDLLYNLHNFFIDEQSEDGMIACRNFLEVVLIFRDEEEKEKFLEFVQDKQDDFKSKLKHENYNNHKIDNKVHQRRFATAKVLKQMFKEFRAKGNERLINV